MCFENEYAEDYWLIWTEESFARPGASPLSIERDEKQAAVASAIRLVQRPSWIARLFHRRAPEVEAPARDRSPVEQEAIAGARR